MLNYLYKKEVEMPKLKTVGSVKKRFRITKNGKVIAGQAGKNHGMVKRNKRQLRTQRGTATLAKCDAYVIIKKFLPGKRKK